MKAVADVCVVPIGVGVSVSKYIAACQNIFLEAGLNPKLHAYGTNIEGDFESVLQAIQRCHETVHKMGAPRISTSIRLGSRVDRDQSMQDKIDSVTSKLKKG
jgi:uncharacterized protein (TIGR00106 family)